MATAARRVEMLQIYFDTAFKTEVLAEFWSAKLVAFDSELENSVHDEGDSD